MKAYKPRIKIKYNPLEKRQPTLTEEQKEKRRKRVRRIKKFESIRNFFIITTIGITAIYIFLKVKGVL